MHFSRLIMQPIKCVNKTNFGVAVANVFRSVGCVMEIVTVKIVPMKHRVYVVSFCWLLLNAA